MRLSSLSSAAVLLLSSVAFAQHQASATPSSPPPAAPAATAPTPVPATSAPATSSPNTGGSHSEPSAPVSTRAPEVNVAPAAPSASHGSPSTFTSSSSGESAPVAHTTTSGAERVVPEAKITGEDKIAPVARIGQDPAGNGHEAKPPESDLRHRVCDGGPCKEPAPKPEQPASDLRHWVCINGNCKCPAGQAAGKGGCVTTSTESQQAYACPAGEWWNGGSCVASIAACANTNNRAEMQLSELRTLSAQIRDACSNDPDGEECHDLKMRREQAVLQYRGLQNEAPLECRPQLPEPPL
jgi:hypothetical protein